MAPPVTAPTTAGKHRGSLLRHLLEGGHLSETDPSGAMGVSNSTNLSLSHLSMATKILLLVDTGPSRSGFQYFQCLVGHQKPKRIVRELFESFLVIYSYT